VTHTKTLWYVRRTLMPDVDISVTSWSSYLYHFDVTGLRQYAVSKQTQTDIHTYIRTLDNVHNSQAQGLNLRSGRLLRGKRTVDIYAEQMDGFLDEIWMSWNCSEIGRTAVTCSRQTVRSSWEHCLPNSDDNVGNASRFRLPDRRDRVGWYCWSSRCR